jgi:pimeloyl-ACP methyl ester carboxylesterase/ubiquinone/menaquinone biosynthesis C-methylase UbiE
VPPIGTRTVVLDSTQLGEGPDVVLSHGLGANQAFWYFRIAPRFADRYRVTLYDLRGHGNSERPPSGYTTRTLAEDLLALMDAQGVERAHLVGHSFGGAVSLHLAALHPERVRSLTLIDSRLHALQPFGSPEDQGYWEDQRERAVSRGHAPPPGTPRWLLPLFEELESLGAGMPPGSRPQQGIWDPKRRSSQRWRALLETTSLLEDLHDVAGLTAEAIAAVSVPTLLVYGERSPLGKTCERLRALLPRVETRVVDGAGHFFPLARPDWVTDTVLTFLGRFHGERMARIDLQDLDTSYEPFSREPEYIDGNRAFVADLPLRPGATVVDVACGTGAISELMLAREPSLTVLGLDLSRESLSLGRTDFVAAGLEVRDDLVLARDAEGVRTRVVLVEGNAEVLPFRSGIADLVFMGHSIHLPPHRDDLLREIFRVMRPGATFAFNSAFYAGSNPPGTEVFYRLWMAKALEYLKQKDESLRAAGQPGLKRQRGTNPPMIPYLTPEEWRELLERHGFAVTSTHERTIPMTQRAHETVGAYSGFARVMVSGYPVNLACEALVHAAGPAMEEAGYQTLPKNWLEIVARKP